MDRFETPILYIIFNRPDLVEITFSRIREIKPVKLFVAADGPRADRPEDVERCKRARDVVRSMIDWECEVRTLFREENLGCGRGPAGAITWFFENVEAGIILEDDCLASMGFFRFCHDLLNYHKENLTIKHISGNTFIAGDIERGSYRFSNYTHSWGWATWADRWELYQYELNGQLVAHEIERVFKTSKERNYWKATFDLLLSTKIDDAWDYQWLFLMWRQRGKAILPNCNLVLNIGFRADASHTFNEVYQLDPQALKDLSHPIRQTIDYFMDLRSFRQHFQYVHPIWMIIYRLKLFFSETNNH